MIKLINNVKKPPRVLIDADVYREMKALVSECDKEIGWLCLSRKVFGVGYEVYELIPVKQEITACTTDLNEKGLQEVYESFVANGRAEELNNIRFWGHSHVNMNPTPSGTDEDTFNEYINDCKDYFIRFILNKKGNYSLDLADYNEGLIYTDLKYELIYSGDELKLMENVNKLREEYEVAKGIAEEYAADREKETKTKMKEVIKSYTTTPKTVVNSWASNYYNRYSNSIQRTLDKVSGTDLQISKEILNMLTTEEIEKCCIKFEGTNNHFIGSTIPLEDIMILNSELETDAREDYEKYEEFNDYEDKDWTKLFAAVDNYMDWYNILEQMGGTYDYRLY